MIGLLTELIEENIINLFTLLAIAAEATDTVPETILSTVIFGENTLRFTHQITNLSCCLNRKIYLRQSDFTPFML